MLILKVRYLTTSSPSLISNKSFIKIYTDLEDDKEHLSPISNGYHEEDINTDINIHLSADVSIDLPPLDWTFQHELPNLDCIGMDTEQTCNWQYVV